MGIKQRIEADIKTAMLSGDKNRALILRTIKSTILESEIAQKKRAEGLAEPELISLLSKEAKKRQDASELYKNAGETERAENEEQEHKIITSYLPAQMSDEELEVIVSKVISEQSSPIEPSQMGKIISSVRELTAGQADGSRIAQMVKQRISG